MKKDRVQNKFLDELKKIPNVQVACERCGISRQSVYRWQKEDPDFKRQMDSAMEEGEILLNDICESQLLVKIKEGCFPAIKYRLDKRHPKYKKEILVVENTSPLDDQRKRFLHLNDDELIAELQGLKKIVAEKREQESSLQPIDTGEDLYEPN